MQVLVEMVLEKMNLGHYSPQQPKFPQQLKALQAMPKHHFDFLQGITAHQHDQWVDKLQM